MENNNWDDMIFTLLEMVREYQDAPSWAMTMKLAEEVGEFSEIMLYEHGYLRHKDKEWKDTPTEEAADIINTLLGALSMHYPDKSSEEISKELFDAMIKKGNKYARVLGAEPDLFTR